MLLKSRLNSCVDFSLVQVIFLPFVSCYRALLGWRSVKKKSVGPARLWTLRLDLNLWSFFWSPRVWRQKLLPWVSVRVGGWVESSGDYQAVVVETRGHNWPLTQGLMERHRKRLLRAAVMGARWRKWRSSSQWPDNRGVRWCWRWGSSN